MRIAEFVLRIAVGAGLALSASCVSPEGLSAAGAERVRGPIPTRIMQPAGLIFPANRPRRAALLEAGEGRATAEIFYASIFERVVRPAEAAAFDGEIARGSLTLQYAPTDGVEVVLEPTVLFASSGFLDSFVDGFHAITGFVGGGRDEFQSDQYSMYLQRNGEVAWELAEDHVRFGDLPITLVSRIREEDGDGPAVAARFTIELPTGDEGRGTGSGGIDAAAGVILERSVGRFTFFGGVDGVHVDQPASFQRAGIDVRSLFSVSGGAEYRWSDRLSLLAQAVLQMPLTRSLPFEEIDREILDLGFGFAYELSGASTLRFSFHEDAVAASGPDLTFYTGISWRF
ncbi:MAG: DUF3187 family protein [Planctomycetota bacterium]|nr:DUF3187 family protein [Planctomycetota bacterium]